MKFKRRFLAAMSIVLYLTMFAACGNKEGDKKPSDNGNKETPKEFVYGNQTTGKTLDPHNEWDGWGTYRAGLVETLFKLNNNLEVEPYLAKGFKNVDPNTWEIEIKDEAKFSNGEKVTGEKVIESLKRAGEKNKRASTLKSAEYKAEGQKVIIKTKDPDAAFINSLCDPNSGIIDVSGSKDIENAPVATGPYKVLKFEPKKLVELVPNENYWNGKPKLSKVTEKYIADSATMSMALQSGEIQAAVNITADVLDVFKKDDKSYTVNQFPSSRNYMVYYNLEKLPDEKVREAISYAIDRKAIAEQLLGGTVTAGKGPFPIGLEYGGKELEVPEYNPNKTKEILTSLGYKENNGLMEKDGKPLTVDLRFYKRLAIEQIGTEIQAQLKKAGITANAKLGEWEYLKTGEYQMGLYGVVTLPIGDPYDFMQKTWGKDGASNYNKYSNPKVEELLMKLKKEFDVKKRGEITLEIQKEALKSNSHLFIGSVNINIVTKKNVEGVRATPIEYTLVDVNTVVK